MEIRNTGLMPGLLMGKRGEKGGINWTPPLNGTYPVRHVDTFINRYTSLSNVYRDYDEALLDNRDNARYMRNDIGIRECLDCRQRSVALLNWHLEPENEQSADQKAFCTMLEDVIRGISHFYEYRRNCQHAIWYGKAGIQHRWGIKVVKGKSVYMPVGRHQDDWGWRPLHGDKVVFRQLRADAELPPGSYEGQMGIRVRYRYQPGDVINNRWKVEPTDYGLAYFLTPQERRLMLVHKHHVEDAAYDDGIRAGSIHGVGIRSVIYWEWFQQKETMAFLMEFLERMAGGIQVWKYPSGNEQAKVAIQQAAENYNSGQEHVLMVPIPHGDPGQYGVEVIDPGFQGVEVLHDLISKYYGHRHKRYILGQTLTSEADATGMGSGVADLHQDTFLQIIKSDSTNLEETLTSDLVAPLIQVNIAKKVWADPGFRPRFVIETDEPDVDKQLEAWASLIDRGLPFRKSDLYEMVGAAMPGPGDDVLHVDPSGGKNGPGAPGGMPGLGGDSHAPGDSESPESPEGEHHAVPAGEAGSPGSSGSPEPSKPAEPDQAAADHQQLRYSRKSQFNRPAASLGIARNRRK